jgi:3-phytase
MIREFCIAIVILIYFWIVQDAFAQDPIVVLSRVETPPVVSEGDAADDPAIWVDNANPINSKIYGTDKDSGIYTYDLEGNELQYFSLGLINNVDVRSGLDHYAFESVLAGTRLDDNSLVIIPIDERGLLDIDEMINYSTAYNTIYGTCLGLINDELYMYVSDEESFQIIEYKIAELSPLGITPNRVFSTQSVSEGCVVDQVNFRLFYSQEDEANGIRSVALNDTQPTPVVIEDGISRGGRLVADSEGLTVIYLDNMELLLASAQDNNAYFVYDITGNESHFINSFIISENPLLSIDGVQETDGIDAYFGNFGEVFPNGIFIAQDGENELNQNQNFKYVSLADVLSSLHL